MSEEIILSTAAYQDQLASGVSGLDHVPDALSQQKACVADIETKYHHCAERLKTLAAETKKTRKAHENWRDSHALRFAHKLTGKKEKYEARESKEEREYVEALEREVQEKQGLEILQQLRSDAQVVLSDLSEKASERQSLKAELSSLYCQVFEGSSEAFPEQDELLQEVEVARITQDEVQIRLSSETQVVELLNRADNQLNACRQTIREAMDYMRWGNGQVVTFDTVGTLTCNISLNDFAFRSLIDRAQTHSDRASAVVTEARLISPSVADIGRVLIMPRMSNSTFSVSDFAFQQQIRNAAAEIVKEHMHLKWQCEAAINRVGHARFQLQEATELLDHKREELDSIRGRIFKQMVYLRSNLPADNPPSYEEAARRDTDVNHAEGSHSTSPQSSEEEWATPDSTEAEA